MEKIICVFGASITWGAWDGEKGGWVNRLKLALESNHDIEVYNLGVSGNNTGDLLKRFEKEVKARKPTIIIFGIGNNDSTFNNSEVSVIIEKFEKNILRLIELGKKFTNNIIFVGLSKVDESKTMPIPWNKKIYYNNESIKKYDEKIQEVTKKNKVGYINIFDLLDKKDLEDGLHPNSQGHEKIFLKIKEFLRENS